MALDLGDEIFIMQSLALRDRADNTENLRRYHGPTLLLCGEEDALCPPIYHAQMSKILSRGVLREIGNAGHISTLEQPTLTNVALKDWLNLTICYYGPIDHASAAAIVLTAANVAIIFLGFTNSGQLESFTATNWWAKSI